MFPHQIYRSLSWLCLNNKCFCVGCCSTTRDTFPCGSRQYRREQWCLSKMSCSPWRTQTPSVSGSPITLRWSSVHLDLPLFLSSWVYLWCQFILHFYVGDFQALGHGLFLISLYQYNCTSFWSFPLLGLLVVSVFMVMMMPISIARFHQLSAQSS